MPFPQEMFLALCRNDPLAVYRMFCTMEESITRLEARVKHLESVLHKDSHNSSKPPSSDKGHKTKSLRQKTERRQGGQPGHQGYTLERVDNPEHTIIHPLKGKCTCGLDLYNGRLIEYERRQVADIPPQAALETTEHRGEIRQCLCGKTHTAQFPAGVDAPVQYGPRIRARMTYFSAYQLLPQKRTVEMIKDIFGVSISEGTLNNTLQQAYGNLETTENEIKERIRKSPVVHLDETGMYVGGKRLWEHGASTEKYTHYFCHEKRGSDATRDSGILWQYLGRIIHDGWKSYFDFECLHALCNAHHLRELVFMKEEYKQRWAGTMIELLCRIKRTVDRAKSAQRQQLAVKTLQSYRCKYEKIIAAGYRANPISQDVSTPKKRGKKKQHPARNLLDRLSTYQNEVLIFMEDFNVPFDNNLIERDLRMTKVKQKISGCFRSMAGAQAFCRIRGFISTVRKHGYNVLDHMEKCFLSTGKELLISDLT